MTDEATTPAFPEQEVRLLSGETVIIRPWSLGLGRLMRKRITDLVTKIQASTDSVDLFSLAGLLEHCETEVIQIVRDTIEKDDAWMEGHLLYEDLITLAQAVISVCIARPDGGGVLGKLLGTAQMVGLTVPVLVPATEEVSLPDPEAA